MFWSRDGIFLFLFVAQGRPRVRHVLFLPLVQSALLPAPFALVIPLVPHVHVVLRARLVLLEMHLVVLLALPPLLALFLEFTRDFHSYNSYLIKCINRID